MVNSENEFRSMPQRDLHTNSTTFFGESPTTNREIGRYNAVTLDFVMASKASSAASATVVKR